MFCLLIKFYGYVWVSIRTCLNPGSQWVNYIVYLFFMKGTLRNFTISTVFGRTPKVQYVYLTPARSGLPTPSSKPLNHGSHVEVCNSQHGGEPGPKARWEDEEHFQHTVAARYWMLMPLIGWGPWGARRYLYIIFGNYMGVTY